MRSKVHSAAISAFVVLVAVLIAVAIARPREHDASPEASSEVVLGTPSTRSPPSTTPTEHDVDTTVCLADSLAPRFEPQTGWSDALARCQADATGCTARCDAREAIACLALGSIALSAGREAESQTMFEKACRLGDGVACTNYAAGLRDLAESPESELAVCATRIFERACARGETLWACGMYGRALARGEGVTSDAPRARRFLDASCTAGSGFACSTLGQALRAGWFGAEEPDAARDAYRRGCTAGYAAACRHAND